MPESTATYSLQQAAYCPQCGYDQRGRAVGDVCPECGARNNVGLAIEQINRWARCSLTDLWCIAILQLIGVACALATMVANTSHHPVVGLLGAAAATYICSAAAWYLVVAFGFVRHRAGPNYRNLSRLQSRALVRWMIVDLVVLLAPAVLFLVPWLLRGP